MVATHSHSVPDFTGTDGDAVERVPTGTFLGPMQRRSAVAPALLTPAHTVATILESLLGLKKLSDYLVEKRLRIC
jgi:hypothetical protein